MPAEIDTGGPRVLHCDYRADCPIPIVVSARTASAASDRRPRAVVPVVPRPGGEADPIRGCPGIEDNPGSGRSRRRRRRWGPERGARRRAGERCTTFNVPNDADVAHDGYARRIGRDSYEDGRAVLVEEEEEEEEVRRPEERLRYDREVSATATPEEEEEKESGRRSRRWRRTSGGGQRRADDEDSGGERGRRKDRWTWRSVLAASGHLTRPFLSSHRATDLSASGKTREQGDRCPKSSSSTSSSYFHLALLLFLVAFGQCGLLARPAPGVVVNCALALGAYYYVGGVSAAPVDQAAVLDQGVRTERSANLSHITGASRKIQMYIKNRHLQILPDGTVNGSNDDTSDYTIFQRTSVSRGQLRIQGVATCLYLCMDSCGLLYGSREYTEDCVFNETLEQHNYNTYSSVRWSTAKKTLYLGLNRRGQPRRVQAKGHNLGRLSAYARVLTQVAQPDRVEALQRRMLGAQHNVRHRHSSAASHHRRSDSLQHTGLCPKLPPQEKDGRDRFRCRKRKKRKKRRRRKPGDKPENPRRDIH